MPHHYLEELHADAYDCPASPPPRLPRLQLPHAFAPYAADWCDTLDDAWTRAHKDEIERVFVRMHQETVSTLGAGVADAMDIRDVASYLQSVAGRSAPPRGFSGAPDK